MVGQHFNGTRRCQVFVHSIFFARVFLAVGCDWGQRQSNGLARYILVFFFSCSRTALTQPQNQPFLSPTHSKTQSIPPETLPPKQASCVCV